MHSAVNPKPVAAMLALCRGSRAPFRSFARTIKDLPCNGVALFPEVEAALMNNIVEECFVSWDWAPLIACKCCGIGKRGAAEGRSHSFQHPAPVERPSIFAPDHLIVTCTLTPAFEAKRGSNQATAIDSRQVLPLHFREFTLEIDSPQELGRLHQASTVPI
jgi:hypothetical protein